MRWLCLIWLVFAPVLARGAVLDLEFSKAPIGSTPPDFDALLSGGGAPGSWSIVQAEVAPAMEIFSADAPRTSYKRVLTQRNHDQTDERFPMFAYQKEEFGDFILTARLRILGGEKEQMAGIAFRLQDADNFYVVRLSALGQNIRFYKVVGGLRGRLIGPSLKVSTNQWYELSIQCRGNEIICLLDGEAVMPPLQDSSFSKGRIAFWTKSDSDCQFAGANISFTPTVPLSKQVLAAALQEYSRVVDLRLYTAGPNNNQTQAIACKNPEDLGSTGDSAELGAIRDGNSYVGKDKGTVTVVMPVRDRNGDPVGAARIVMDSFPGQTDNNAIVRARPIVQLMEGMIETSQEPFN